MEAVSYARQGSRGTGNGELKARLQDSTQFQARIGFVLFPRAGAPENPDGYTICRAIHQGTGEEIVMKGRFGPVSEGELIGIEESTWKEDGRYGAFLQVWKRSYEDPVSKDAVISYLSKLPGVGPGLARSIVETLGDNCLERVDADPSLLLSVRTANGRRIKPEEMQDVMAKWQTLRASRKNLLYLSTIGLGDYDARKVSDHFGDRCQEVIKEDPYQLTVVEGIGFITADKVAQKMGIHSTDPRRLAAGMEYLLQVAEGDGHVCLPREEMLGRAPKLLDRGFAKPKREELDEAIKAMVADGRLWAETGDDGVERIYTTEMFTVETRLYQHLHDRLKDIDDPDHIPGFLVTPEKSMLTDEQYGALWRGRNFPMSLLTGGPGCGKTTTLKELLDDLDERGESYACMAPTGKAAKRMKESTGRDASTIHRKLRELSFDALNPPKHITGPGYDEEDYLKEDVIIVDETSMLDMRLAERLLSHTHPDSRVVFVGDPDQLPAVGAGSVLLDLIESQRVPRTHLTKVFRQKVSGKDTASLLLANAARIRNGQEPYWTAEEAEAAIAAGSNDPQADVWNYVPYGTEAIQRDFEFVEIPRGIPSDAAQAEQLLGKKTVAGMRAAMSAHGVGPREAVAVAKTLETYDRLSDELGVHPDDILVTGSMRKGGTGTHVLNTAVQAKRNPNGKPFKQGDQPLRVGDRVMNTKNRYGKVDSNTREVEPDIMNGDVGVVTNYDDSTKVTTVQFEDGEITYTKEELKNLIGGFVSTTHKLQGSEGAGIVCPYISRDPSNPSRMLTRNLIYTAITRGKKRAVIVGDKETVAAAVQRDGSARNTTLDLRIGAIPKRVKERLEKVQAQSNLQSVQQLLGGFAVNRVGHRDATPASDAA